MKKLINILKFIMIIELFIALLLNIAAWIITKNSLLLILALFLGFYETCVVINKFTNIREWGEYFHKYIIFNKNVRIIIDFIINSLAATIIDIIMITSIINNI